MLRLAATGAGLAGAYGAVHDQISFAISSEYFTKVKFAQFHWAGATGEWGSRHPRVFASVVGVLATWWVGAFAGWFLARAGLDQLAPTRRRSVTACAFASLALCAAVGGAASAVVGTILARAEPGSWSDWQQRLDLQNTAGFATVAWLHSGGYVGGLIGLSVGIVTVRRAYRSAAASYTPPPVSEPTQLH